MSKIFSNYSDGSTLTASDYNKAVVDNNNILVKVGNNNGVPLSELDDNGIKGGFNYIATARGQAFDVSGTANNIILTTNSRYQDLVLQGYKNFIKIGFIAVNTNTSAVVINVDSLGSKAVKDLSGNDLQANQIIAGQYYELLFNESSNYFYLLNLSEVQTGTIITPYSVMSAKTTNGKPDFMTRIDNNTVGFDFTTPITICYGDGALDIRSNSTQLTNGTVPVGNGTYAIVVEEGNAAPQFVLISNVIESDVEPTSPVNGMYWLDISVKPYISKKYNGTNWNIMKFAKLGEITRSTIIGTPVNYALNGFYDSGEFTTSGTNTFITKNHYIGSQLIDVKLYQKSNSDTTSYQMPDKWYSNVPLGSGWQGLTRLKVDIGSGAGSVGGGFELMTHNAIWGGNYARFICKRSF